MINDVGVCGIATTSSDVLMVHQMTFSWVAQDTLTQEFAACSARVIQMVNNGKINMRTKGKKRDSIVNGLVDLRKKTVEIVKSEGVAVKEKFKAVSLSRWRANNPGLDPVEQGYKVRTLTVPGRGRMECVLMRKSPPEEFDVELHASLDSVIKEEYDAGDVRLRSGQEEKKFDYIKNKVTEVGALDADAKSYDEYRAKQGLAALNSKVEAKPVKQDPHSQPLLLPSAAPLLPYSIYSTYSSTVLQYIQIQLLSYTVIQLYSYRIQL